MSTRKTMAVVNGGMLIGIFISIFLAPPQTPVWLWAVVSAAVLLVMNYLFLRRLKAGSPPSRKSVGSTVIVVLGFVVLLLELGYRLLHQ